MKTKENPKANLRPINTGWGEAAINNNIGWGQCAVNVVGWGESQFISYSGQTNISGKIR